MMREMKTYGVYGLMDWQPIIRVGRAKFCPLFTGGGATAYGQTPAKYATSNEVCQRIIENSDYFKSGHIKLLYSNEIEEAKDLEVCAESHDDGAEYVEKVFPSMGDAASYVADSFGTPKSKLRTRDAIVSAGKAHNVNIKIAD
jgi:hypothetical protein|nr:MAG TPA: hypothetical protein [Caudoviricetes sp.]